MVTLTLANADTPSERRRYARHDVTRPCKVFRPTTCRYTTAVTKNVSASGVLLEISAPRPILPGERLDVAVAWTRSPILGSDALVTGQVVRVDQLDDDRQQVAVAFDNIHRLAAAA